MKDIPTILLSQELLDFAFHRASKITVEDKKPYFRIKKTETGKIKSISDLLDSKILKMIRSFPSFDNLHPFTAEMMDIQFSRDKIRISLGRADGIRKGIRSICGKALVRIKRSRNTEEIKSISRSVYGRVSSLVRAIDDALVLLSEVREVLRKMPDISSEVFTVVVAGFPNVGKSALVNELSTAAPEIAHYPFTTHNVIVGHLTRKVRRSSERIQIIDTPGILERPPEEHNEFEKRAFSALKNLAHAIIFVVDASEYCGYPLIRQEKLLSAVEKYFEEVPIIHVISKTDIEKDRARLFLSKREEKWLPLSSTEKIGLDELKEILFDLRNEFEHGNHSQSSNSDSDFNI